MRALLARAMKRKMTEAMSRDDAATRDVEMFFNSSRSAARCLIKDDIR